MNDDKLQELLEGLHLTNQIIEQLVEVSKESLEGVIAELEEIIRKHNEEA